MHRPYHWSRPVLLLAFCLILSSPSGAVSASGTHSSADHQWLFHTPKSQLNDRLSRLADKLDHHDLKAAQGILNKWLTQDFFGALAFLPDMDLLFDYYHDHYLWDIYASHLYKYGASASMEILANLDFANSAVRKVGVQLLSVWWHKSPETLSRWLHQSPGFRQDLYFEEFIHNALADDKSDYKLALLFWQLKDARGSRYTTRVVEHWVKNDFPKARDFVEQALGHMNARSLKLIDPSVETISYHYIQLGDYLEALRWANRITGITRRDLTIKGVAMNITKVEDKQRMLEWLNRHPVHSADIRQSIDRVLINHSVKSNEADK